MHKLLDVSIEMEKNNVLDFQKVEHQLIINVKGKSLNKSC